MELDTGTKKIALTRARALIKSAKSRKKDGFDLTANWMWQKVQDNGGRCASCDFPMRWKAKTAIQRLEMVSLDRLTPSGPYCQSNIRLVCWFCNQGRNAADLGPWTLFTKLLWSGGELTRDMISVSKENMQSPKIWITKTSYRKPEIRRAWLKELVQKSQGRCAISGIPMICSKKSYFPFKPSVDRIDNNLTYTKTNSQLVCLGINIGRGSLDLTTFKRWVRLRQGTFYKKVFMRQHLSDLCFLSSPPELKTSSTDMEDLSPT